MELSLTPVAFEQLIFTFRGTRVMVDYDLANAYDVATKVLKQQVRRNLLRFPVDFMPARRKAGLN